METSEHLAKEYKALTDKYATASRHIKELLYQISALPDGEKPDFKTAIKLLNELNELEDVLEYVTGRLHYIFNQLMTLIEEDKPKKKATTLKALKTAPKKPKKVKKEK